MTLNLFFIAAAAVLVPLLGAIFLARGVALLDTAVANAAASLEEETRGYNPAATAGHHIKVGADLEEQIREARRLAARRAAALPRGANMRIGRADGQTRTAQDGVREDPLTAVKIAAFHGWQGALQGAPVGVQPAARPVARGAAAAPAVKRELVPGEDYPVIEITDGMDPADVRQARIANAKAKSAAMKALKAAAQGAPVAAPVGETAPAPAAAVTAAPVPAPAAANIPEPDLIEITDDMDPADVRKARIANAKAMSAYKKALKAAGVAPSAAPAPAPAAVTTGPDPDAATTAPAPAEAAPAASSAAADIPEPDLIEITDDMDPADVRQARIANAKAMSAYKKALKAAGIDPSSVG